MAILCKGAIKAFCNLMNRWEEAVGDCTNIHTTYPALLAGCPFTFEASRVAAIVTEEVAAAGPRQDNNWRRTTLPSVVAERLSRPS